MATYWCPVCGNTVEADADTLWKPYCREFASGQSHPETRMVIQ